MIIFRIELNIFFYIFLYIRRQSVEEVISVWLDGEIDMGS